jgi:hypothetical protein
MSSGLSHVLALRREAPARRKSTAPILSATATSTPPHVDVEHRRWERRACRSDRVLLESRARDAMAGVLREHAACIDALRAQWSGGFDVAASVTIQKYFRRWRIQRRFMATRRALLTLQCAGRGRNERHFGIGVLYAREEARSLFQRLGRAMLERRLFNIDVMARVREHHKRIAATNIQKNFKMHSSRSGFLAKRRQSRGAQVLQRVMLAFMRRERERQRVAVWVQASRAVALPPGIVRVPTEEHSEQTATNSRIVLERWEFARRQWIQVVALEGAAALGYHAELAARAMRRRRLCLVGLGRRMPGVSTGQRRTASRPTIPRLRAGAPPALMAANFASAGSAVPSPSMASPQSRKSIAFMSSSGGGDSILMSDSQISPGGRRKSRSAAAVVRAHQLALSIRSSGLDGSLFADDASTDAEALAASGRRAVDGLDAMDDAVMGHSNTRDAGPGVLSVLTAARRRVLATAECSANETLGRANLIVAEVAMRTSLFFLHARHSARLQIASTTLPPWPVCLSEESAASDGGATIKAHLAVTIPPQFFLLGVDAARQQERNAEAERRVAEERSVVANEAVRAEALAAERAERHAHTRALRAAVATRVDRERQERADARRAGAAVRLQAWHRGNSTRSATRCAEASARGQQGLKNVAVGILQAVGRGHLSRGAFLSPSVTKAAI